MITNSEIIWLAVGSGGGEGRGRFFCVCVFLCRMLPCMYKGI